VSLRRAVLPCAGALWTSVLCACTQYHPAPITPAQVDRNLAQPTMQELNVKASAIQHPILKPIAIDDRNGLTPDQAAIIAVVANPSLRAARDRRGVAAAQLLQAGLLPNPQLNFGDQYNYAGMLDGAVTASEVGLSWDVSQLLSHDARVRAAKADSASVDLDIAWQEWQTAQAARTAVYDVIALETEDHLARQIAEQLQRNLSIVRGAVDRHDKTLLDLSAAESASLDANSAVLTQQRDLEDARLTLNKALGLPPDAKVKLSPQIELPAALDVPQPAAVLAGLENRRLDLMALRLGYQSEEETLRAAVIDQFPKINLGFNRQRDNTNVQSLGFAVTVDLPVFDRNQGVIHTETATRQKLFDEYVDRVYQARYDVYTAIDDLSAIARQIAAEEQSIPSMQRLIDTYQSAFGQGNVDVLSYYTAINNLAQKQLDIVKLKQQLMDNQIALELAGGEYLHGG
jgi:outer membrane protein TolC